MNYQELSQSIGKEKLYQQRPVICIQGLGFVGTAMAITVARACDDQGEPYFNVVGLDLDNPQGREKIRQLNEGHLPLVTGDEKLKAAYQQAHEAGNLLCTVDESLYEHADIVVVDIHQDVDVDAENPDLSFGGLKGAIRTLGSRIPKECLVLVETTVPPGTCEKIVAPVLAEEFQQRGFDRFQLAHSYERVMPGPDYYDSIANFWRVFAGHTPEAGDKAEAFLEKVINTADYPLTRLQSTTASETAKVLENSYRAVNIAFIDEWGRFAEQAGIDLFEIVQAIRMRPTHSNIRQPGFGVGGYCLTKDPLFTPLAAKDLFALDIPFPFSRKAVEVNRKMPLSSIARLQEKLGDLNSKKLLLMGVSYRSLVGDTRYSASEVFYHEAIKLGAAVHCHDPLVEHWEELNLDLEPEVPASDGFDAVVLAVDHPEYKSFDYVGWAQPGLVILDSNNILERNVRAQLRDKGCSVLSIGRGDQC